jgi:hypothetical protein
MFIKYFYGDVNLARSFVCVYTHACAYAVHVCTCTERGKKQVQDEIYILEIKKTNEEKHH